MAAPSISPLQPSFKVSVQTTNFDPNHNDDWEIPHRCVTTVDEQRSQLVGRSDTNTSARDNTAGHFGDDESRTMIDDGIERTLTGLQSAASSVADFFQSLTAVDAKNSSGRSGTTKNTTINDNDKLTRLRDMSCGGREEMMYCGDTTKFDRPIAVVDTDIMTPLMTKVHQIKDRIATGPPSDALTPGTRNFGALFYGLNSPDEYDNYGSTSDDESASVNTFEIMRREEEDQLRRLGSWNTLDSSEQAPLSAPVLNLDTIDCAYYKTPTSTKDGGFVDIPEELPPPPGLSDPSFPPSSVRSKFPLPPSSRMSCRKSVATTSTGSLSTDVRHSHSLSSTNLNVPRSDSSTCSQKSVSFAYPPIKSLKNVPRIPVEDLPNLFFTSKELSQIETDRYSTRGSEDVETIAVLAPEHQVRKHKRRLVTQVQIYLRSSTRAPRQRQNSSG